MRKKAVRSWGASARTPRISHSSFFLANFLFFHLLDSKRGWRLEVGGHVRTRVHADAQRRELVGHAEVGRMAAGRRWAGRAGPNERRTRRGAWYSPNTPTAGHTANHARSVRVCATGGVSIGVPRSRGTVNAALECLRQPARVIGLRSGHSAVSPGPTFSRGERSAFDGQAQEAAKMRAQGEPADRSTRLKNAVTDHLRRAL